MLTHTQGMGGIDGMDQDMAVANLHGYQQIPAGRVWQYGASMPEVRLELCLA